MPPKQSGRRERPDDLGGGPAFVFNAAAADGRRVVWTFTYWGRNPPLDAQQVALVAQGRHPHIAYIVFQRELTANGRQHWQGYLELRTGTRMTRDQVADMMGWDQT